MGEKQSSPMSMRVLVTLRPSTFNESNPSVFLGRAFRMSVYQAITLKRSSLTDALVEYALIKTSSKETSLVRTKKLVQQGELSWVIPSTLMRVALSVRKRIGR